MIYLMLSVSYGLSLVSGYEAACPAVFDAEGF